MTALVVVHGCHLRALNWEEIAFGYPEKGELGVIPFALKQALAHEALYMFWGTGASQRKGLYESEYAHKLACDRIDELHDLICKATDSRGRKIRYYRQKERLKKLLLEKSIIDKSSQNLREEVENAVAFCLKKKLEIYRIIPVSSATHIQRCFSTFFATLHGLGLNLDLIPYGTRIGFAGALPSDVVVVEPPHRGDLPLVPFHRTVARLFQFLHAGDDGVAFDVNDDLSALIDDYERQMR